MNKQDLARKINDLLIIKQDDGSYHLFGRYSIVKNDNLYTVFYAHDSAIKVEFAQLKHAVTWCVFHKNMKHKDLPKIHELDEKLEGLSLSITNLKRLVEKGKNENKTIYLAKLFEGKMKKKIAQKDMDEYVTTSKYWQSKSFKDNQHV